jgi:hypothetical protein
MLSTDIKKAKTGELLNYLNDIKRVAIQMEKTRHPEVRGCQLESINFSLQKAEILINELI